VTPAPVLPIGRNEPAAPTDETLIEYLYEQPPDEVFSILLPKLVETQIFRALLESVASEHGARMTAMDSATKNANEVIDRLTLNMNRVRQAAITREIIEVVSGAEAL
jgi:F-type H+-transporting ATPase subunit gamma